MRCVLCMLSGHPQPLFALAGQQPTGAPCIPMWPQFISPSPLSTLSADASQVAGLDPAFLSALQFVEHAESAELAQQLHAAANNPRAWADAQAMLQRLLPHSGDAQAGSQLAGMLEFNTAGREATIRLLLMGAMVGGIDAKSAPLRLKPTAAGAAGTAELDAAARADLEWLRTQQALYAAKAELPAGLLLVGRQASSSGSSSDDAAAAAGKTTGSGRGGGGGNATSVTTVHLSWQQQQRMAPLYRLLHKHCTELERMRSAGGWVGCVAGWCGRECLCLGLAWTGDFAAVLGGGSCIHCHSHHRPAPLLPQLRPPPHLCTADHRHLIPLVELSLAIMRLSCERFFSLLAVSALCTSAPNPSALSGLLLACCRWLGKQHLPAVFASALLSFFAVYGPRRLALGQMKCIRYVLHASPSIQGSCPRHVCPQVFLGFLAFHDPPPAAQRAIRVISLFASVFQARRRTVWAALYL